MLVPISLTEPKAEGCNGAGRSYYLLSISSSWTFIDLFYCVFDYSFITFHLLSLLFPFISLNSHFPFLLTSVIVLIFFISLHTYGYKSHPIPTPSTSTKISFIAIPRFLYVVLPLPFILKYFVMFVILFLNFIFKYFIFTIIGSSLKYIISEGNFWGIYF